MVDVGAHHGGALEAFAQSGWSVHAFEPDPSNRAELMSGPGRMPSVHVDSRAITEIDGDQLELFTSDVSSGISTLTAFHPSHHATATVETVRLDTYLARIDRVDFLKVDTEGHDLFVLKTFPWSRLKPQALVCEFEDRKTVPLGYGYRDLAQFLVDQGYVVLVSEWYPIVEYGLSHRWRAMHRYPHQLASADAWGNLIAVEPRLLPRARRLARRAKWQLTVRHALDRLR
jgi:FkbM family methyltransferase